MRWLKLVDEYYALVEVKDIVCIVEIVELNTGVWGVIWIIWVVSMVRVGWKHMDTDTFAFKTINWS